MRGSAEKARRFAVPGLAALLLVAGGAAAAPGIGPEAARHLLNRAGFDARPAAIDEIAALSRRDAAQAVLAGNGNTARTPPPAWVGEFVSPLRIRSFTDAERAQFQRQLVERGLDLKNWWVTELLTTRSPLTERMTLFWHNHFTSSLQKVRSASLLYRQNVVLRQHALGNFATLLRAAAKDPAMLVYLDAAASRSGQPNENFAREVMELFTLGEGSYTEQDIREAARAFTGWSIDFDSGTYLWRPRAHDAGSKTVLGRTGRLSGDDVLDILLARSETAEFVVNKLWKEFVSPDPDRAEVRRIAAVFRHSGYDIRAALREVFTSDAFYDDRNRGALIKSPVELVIGSMRQFDVGFSDPLPLTLLLRSLGQDLFSPPNVKGWPGGQAWVNSTTLLARRQFLERLFRVDEAGMQAQGDGTPRAIGVASLPRERPMRASLDLRFSAGEWLRQFASVSAQQGLPLDRIQRVLLATSPAAEGTAGGAGAELLRRITADPAYQLR